jgi:hypothetical protein
MESLKRRSFLWASWIIGSSLMGEEGGTIDHRMGSHWMMGSKWFGVVGRVVGVIMGEGRREKGEVVQYDGQVIAIASYLVGDVSHIM